MIKSKTFNSCHSYSSAQTFRSFFKRTFIMLTSIYFDLVPTVEPISEPPSTGNRLRNIWLLLLVVWMRKCYQCTIPIEKG